MNNFCLDAVIHLAGAVTRIDVPRWLDWSAYVVYKDALGPLLCELREPLGVRRMPNDRMAGTQAVVSLLQVGADRTAADLRAFRDAHAQHAVHPEAVIELAAMHGCSIHFDRSASHDVGALEVVFLPANVTDAFTGVTLPRFDALAATPGKLINDPATHRMEAGAALPLQRFSR